MVGVRIANILANRRGRESTWFAVLSCDVLYTRRGFQTSRI